MNLPSTFLFVLRMAIGAPSSVTGLTVIPRAPANTAVWWLTPGYDPGAIEHFHSGCGTSVNNDVPFSHLANAPLWEDCRALYQQVEAQEKLTPQAYYTVRGFTNESARESSRPLSLMSVGSCIYGIKPRGNVSSSEDLYYVRIDTIKRQIQLAVENAMLRAGRNGSTSSILEAPAGTRCAWSDSFSCGGAFGTSVRYMQYFIFNWSMFTS